MKYARTVAIFGLVALGGASCDIRHGRDCATGKAIVVHVSQSFDKAYPNCTPEQIAELEQANARIRQKEIDAIFAPSGLAKPGPAAEIEVPGAGAGDPEDPAIRYKRTESSSVH